MRVRSCKAFLHSILSFASEHGSKMRHVKAAADAYRVYFRAHDDGADDFYLVDHSTFTYLVLPTTGFVEFFRRDTSAEDVARTTACFLERA